jgi:predicted glycoside hydrolase/deacetylase ChbG (UPF0249 family)
MSTVVTADDLGLCPAIDEAICLLHDRGVIGRASLVANGPSFAAAVALLTARPTLEVALHLNLTDGAPVLPARDVPSLVDARGQFPGGRHYGVALALAMGRMSRDEVYREWYAQAALVRDAGLVIRELNAHGHLHLLPALREVVLRLRRAFAVPRVRLVRSAEWPKGRLLSALSAGLARRLRADGVDTREPERTFGLKHSGGVDTAIDLQALASGAGSSTELIVHPATGPNPYHAQWGYDGAAVTAWLLTAEGRFVERHA